MTSLQIKPFVSSNPEKRFKSLGALICIRAGAEQTGGAFNLFDALLPVRYETPLHIHYAEDVAIQVLEGMLEIFWGEESMQAVAGSFFFQPRGTPHGWRVTGRRPARILYMNFPAGFDEFVIERSQAPADFETMGLEARYKIEVLGPLPE